MIEMFNNIGNSHHTVKTENYKFWNYKLENSKKTKQEIDYIQNHIRNTANNYLQLIWLTGNQQKLKHATIGTTSTIII